MSKKMGLAPKLRFPEFQDEWKQYFGNQLFDPINNKDHDSSLPVLAITQEHGAIPRDLIDYQVSVTDKSIESYKVVEIGDFIISLRSFQGGIEYSRYKGICSPAYIILRKNTDVSEEYFKYFFKTDRFIQQLQKNLEGLRDGKMVSYQQFSELLLPTPSTPEQQKIADCLTSLDALIAAERAQLDALKAYKKGLLQNLFPAEGESLPRLRFPEFQSAGEWETAILGEVYSFKVTNTFSRDQLSYATGSVKNIHYGDIHTKFSTLFDITKETVPYINPSQPVGKIKLESYCVEGDMIFADASEDLNDVGKSIEIVNLNNEKLVSGLHTLLARQITPKLAIGFGGYLFKSDRIRTQIKKEAQGAKVLGISSGRLSNIEICFPSNKKEQQKIAELLTSIDEEIAAQGQRVAGLGVHKQGLLQGLFP
jgi:type I restriction enzyme S subunit